MVKKKTINVKEIFDLVFKISGWKNYHEVLRAMTPEEKRKWATR